MHNDIMIHDKSNLYVALENDELMSSNIVNLSIILMLPLWLYLFPNEDNFFRRYQDFVFLLKYEYILHFFVSDIFFVCMEASRTCINKTVLRIHEPLKPNQFFHPSHPVCLIFVFISFIISFTNLTSHKILD